jgi:hypothetical protein
MARALNDVDLATLLIDLLTPYEEGLSTRRKSASATEPILVLRKLSAAKGVQPG